MDDLKARLDAVARQFQPSSLAWERTLRRVERRRLRRKTSALVVAAAVVVGAAVPLWTAFRTDVGQPVPPINASQYEVDLTVQLPRGISDVGLSPGSVWATHPGGVLRLDAATGRQTAEVDVAGVDERSSLAVGDGDIWVTAADRLVRIDAGTGQVVDRRSLDGVLLGVAFGEDSVWATRASEAPPPPVLMRVDPATGEAVGTFDIGPGPGPVLTGGGFVWAANTSAPTELTRIEPGTGSITSIAIGSAPALTFGAGSLWAAIDDEVLRVDPVDLRIVGRIEVPRAHAIAFADGAVWVLSGTGSKSQSLYLPDPDQPAALLQIDPVSERIVGHPITFSEFTPASLTADDAGVWVAFFDSGVVHRVRLAAQP